jgi:hypothetical protein
MSLNPDCIQTEPELDELLTRPSERLVAFIKSVSSPLLVLGAGGKMGPTLVVLARRAAEAAGHPLDIVAVSRFSNPTAREWLEARGVKTLNCDLLDATAISRLPEASNLIYLVGLKFGTAQNPAATWAINTLVPARVCERFPTQPYRRALHRQRVSAERGEPGRFGGDGSAHAVGRVRQCRGRP